MQMGQCMAILDKCCMAYVSYTCNNFNLPFSSMIISCVANCKYGQHYTRVNFEC